MNYPRYANDVFGESSKGTVQDGMTCAMHQGTAHCDRGLVELASCPATYEWRFNDWNDQISAESIGWVAHRKPDTNAELLTALCQSCFFNMISKYIDKHRAEITKLCRLPIKPQDSRGGLRPSDTETDTLVGAGYRGLLSLEKLEQRHYPVISKHENPSLKQHAKLGTLSMLSNGEHCIGAYVHFKDLPKDERDFDLPFQTKFTQKGKVKQLFGREIQWALINPRSHTWSFATSEPPAVETLPAFLKLCKKPATTIFDGHFFVRSGDPFSELDVLWSPSRLVFAKRLAKSSGDGQKSEDGRIAGEALYGLTEGVDEVKKERHKNDSHTGQQHEQGGHPGELDPASSSQASTQPHNSFIPTDSLASADGSLTGFSTPQTAFGPQSQDLTSYGASHFTVPVFIQGKSESRGPPYTAEQGGPSGELTASLNQPYTISPNYTATNPWYHQGLTNFSFPQADYGAYSQYSTNYAASQITNTGMPQPPTGYGVSNVSFQPSFDEEMISYSDWPHGGPRVPDDEHASGSNH